MELSHEKTVGRTPLRMKGTLMGAINATQLRRRPDVVGRSVSNGRSIRRLAGLLGLVVAFASPAQAQECANPVARITEQIIANGGELIASVPVERSSIDTVYVFRIVNSNPALPGLIITGGAREGCLVSPPSPVGQSTPPGIDV